MNKKLAEFIGIMLGDGNLGIYNSEVDGKIKTQNRIRISLDSRNNNYLKHVYYLMKEVLNVEPKIHYKEKENVVDIGIYRKDKFFFLRDELGLKESPKVNCMEIPKEYFESEFANYVLKGLFDTDGCLSIFNNNGVLYPRIEIKVCPSPAQKQFLEVLDRLGFNYKVQNLNRKWIRIRISGKKELKKWFDLIGSSNKIHLDKAHNFI
ncbi:MAG: LAGLIDADG family homing endonuclease [bacterium]